VAPDAGGGQQKPTGGYDDEVFDEPRNLSHEYEIPKSAEEANKELRELFEGAMELGGEEIDMEEAIVEGFADGIVLKAHQVFYLCLLQVEF